MRTLQNEDGPITGVCESYGNWIGIDPNILRVAFAICAFIYGAGIPLYIVLWIVLFFID